MAAAAAATALAPAAEGMAQLAACAAANRLANCAAQSLGSHSWARLGKSPAAGAGLVAFGSGNYVAIYEPVEMRMLCLMSGHSDRVNAVAWVHSTGSTTSSQPHYADETELVSCSTDGTLRVWQIEQEPLAEDSSSFARLGSIRWRCTAAIAAHKGSVTALAAQPLLDGKLAVASVSSDLTLKVWLGSSLSSGAAGAAAGPGVRQWQQVGCLQLKPVSMMQALAVTTLPMFSHPLLLQQMAGQSSLEGTSSSSSSSSSPHLSLDSYGLLLAAGGVDCKVHFYSLTGSCSSSSGSAAPAPPSQGYVAPSPVPVAAGCSIRELLSLPGHRDWIRSLAFSHHSQLDALFNSSSSTSSKDSSSSSSSAVLPHQPFHFNKEQEASSGCSPHSGTLMLASASQDCKLRLWKLSTKSLQLLKTQQEQGGGGAAAAAAAKAGILSAASELVVEEEEEEDVEAEVEGEGSGGAGEGPALFKTSMLLAVSGREDPLLSAEDPVLAALQRPKAFGVTVPISAAFSASAAAAAVPSSAQLQCSYEVVFDALLNGHEGWVSSLQWHPPVALLQHSEDSSTAQASSSSSSSSSSSFTSSRWQLWQPPCLLSCSMDKSVILWQPAGRGTGAAVVSGSDHATSSSSSASSHPGGDAEEKEAGSWEGVWNPCIRVGGAGMAIAGLYSALLSPDASTILATGYQGALHSWRCPGLLKSKEGKSRDSSSSGSSSSLPRGLRCLWDVSHFQLSSDDTVRGWQATPALLGHFGALTDAAWGSGGAYLVSCANDFTTRVWAETALQAKEEGAGAAAPSSPSSSSSASISRCLSWQELGRPQIHGYEMSAAVVPGLPGLPHRLLSAGDEKVIRAFDAPLHFMRALQAVSMPALQAQGYAPDSLTAAAASFSPAGGAVAAAAAASTPFSILPDLLSPRAEFAYVPELGLTNKAIQAEGVGAPILDRFQIDGRDAVSRKADASASSMNRAVQQLLGGGTAAAGGGEEEGGSASAAAAAGDEEGTERTTRRQAAATAEEGTGSDSSSELPPVSTASTEAAGVEPVNPSSLLPLLEDDCVQHTHWPESNRLFSHTHEVIALAVNSRGNLLASACKARDETQAAILLWDAVSGQLLQTLKAHKLSVISLQFSHAPGLVQTLQQYRGEERGEGAAAVREGDATFVLASGDVAAAQAGGAEASGSSSSSSSGSSGSGSSSWESDYLVCVSKDRSLAVFGRDRSAEAAAAAAAEGAAQPLLSYSPAGVEEGSGAAEAASSQGKGPLQYPAPVSYKLLAHVRAAHKRIIWTVSWAPLPLGSSLSSGSAIWRSLLQGQGQSFSSSSSSAAETLTGTALFATGSRDHRVKLWTISRLRQTAEVGAGGLQVEEALKAGAAAHAGGAAGEGGEGEGAAGAGAEKEGKEGSAAAAAAPSTSAGGSLALSCLLTLPDMQAPVTAVAFAPVAEQQQEEAGDAPGAAPSVSLSLWLAAGLDTGAIVVFRGKATPRTSAGGAGGAGDAAAGATSSSLHWSWTAVHMLPTLLQQVSTVKRLAWRPLPPFRKSTAAAASGNGKGNSLLEEEALQLASASTDSTLRIFRVWLK